MNIKKFVGYVGIAAASTAAAFTASPLMAFAFDGKWNANDMIKNAYGEAGTNISVGNFNATNLATWVGTITTWALGLAIAAFVLRIVLTAIDRMVFRNVDTTSGKQGQSVARDNETALERIPFVGAYPAATPWKDIFIHFGKQVAIVAGAWILVQLVVNVILFVFGAITPGAK